MNTIHKIHGGVGRLLAALLGLSCLAALAPAQAQVPDTPFNYSRSSGFSYYPNGQLKSETVEPGQPDLCVQTTYTYDDWGNKSGSAAANCVGASTDAKFDTRSTTLTWSRASMPTFAIGSRTVTLQKGQFPLDSVNPETHASAQLFDPRFGAATEVKDANGLKVTVTYDDLGRKVEEVKADGTGTVWRYCVIGGRGLDTSTNSTGCGGLDFSPADAVQYVQSWPISTAGNKSGPWSAAFTDRLGRVIREATQGFDGEEQPENLKGATIVRDMVYGVTGVKLMETQPYWVDTGTSNNSGSNYVGVSKVTVDVLGRTTAIYRADGDAANQTPVAFGSGAFGYGAYGSLKAAVTTISYSSGKTTTVNDLGYKRIEEKNALGEVFRTTDPYGAQVVLQNDAFGNLRYTKDPLGNLNTVSSDYRGRKVGFTDRDAGYTSYAYNALGELIRQQTAVQHNKTPETFTTFKYDKLGRKTTQVDDEYTSTWTYDQYVGGGACLKGVLCESNTNHGVRKRYWYDSVGRPTSERLDYGTTSMVQSRGWDAATGRVVSRTWPTGFKVKYGYTSLGHLARIVLPVSTMIKPLPATPGGTAPAEVQWDANKVIWRAKAMNAWGRYAEFANGDSTESTALNTRILYQALSGQTYKRMVGMDDGTGVLNQDYGWDSLGRLIARTDLNGKTSYGDDISESFLYDKVDRLTHYDVAGPDIPNLQRSVNLTYNALGMLLKRSDVGEYTYPPVVDGTNTVRPHALKSLRDLGKTDTNYFYDANGNLTVASDGKYRNVQYTSFNQPSSDLGLRGPAGSPKHTWHYDETHARVKEVRTIASGTMAGTQTTWRWHPDNAGGLGFEHEISEPKVASDENPATQQSRHYVSAAGQVIAVFVMDAKLKSLADDANVPPVLGTFNVRKVEGWHVDHLGSLITTTDHANVARARYSYDPFGQRRFTTGAADPEQTLEYDWSLTTNVGTANGFTGHQHLDDVGLVHMNGRMFDPRTGVFVQADPSIQDPFNLQSHNRYMYCMAGPLSCTDPTGYNWLSKTWHKLWRNPVFKTVVIIAVTYYTGGAAAEYFGSSVAGGAVGGFAGGAMSTGTLKGGVQGAFTGAVFAGVGDYLNGTGGWANADGTKAAWAPGESSLQGVALHGVAGCVTSVAGGGKCGPGALSAAFSQAAMPLKQGQNFVVGTLISAAIGGTASVLGGGKFDNGAATAAYGYLFNHWAHWAELAAHGQEAHQLLQNEMEQYGYVVESKCATPYNCVDGRFDIARAQSLEVWEIKRNSEFGLAMGELALDAYTAPQTGLRRGGDLIGLKVGAELSLWKGWVEYEFTNYGDGLIGYSRYDHTPARPVYVPRILPLPGGRRNRDDQFGF